MSRAQLALTPEAVAAVLTGAGFEAAEMDDYWHRPVTDGFHTCLLPVTHEDRVAVMWHANPYGGYDRLDAVTGLAQCTTVLERAGYQVEFVTEAVSDVYLAVWVEGEF